MPVWEIVYGQDTATGTKGFWLRVFPEAPKCCTLLCKAGQAVRERGLAGLRTVPCLAFAGSCPVLTSPPHPVSWVFCADAQVATALPLVPRMQYKLSVGYVACVGKWLP